MPIRDLVLAALFAALTAVGALFSVGLPFTTVPFSLQVFFVLLAGALLGPVTGTASQLVYLLLGAIGLPIFAQGQAGLGVLFGPTGGFLLAFPVAALGTGLMASRTGFGISRPLARMLLATLVGILLIYLGGTLGLMFFAGLTWTAALKAGVLPFIGFDLLKAGLAAPLALRVRTAVGGREGSFRSRTT